MPPHALHGLKKSLFRVSGPRLYRLLHAGWFFLRLLRALGSRSNAERFFGNDVMAFSSRLRPGFLVLDIGAFLGGSTALFARAVGLAGRVIAFEPVHFRFLRFLISILRFSVLLPSGLRPGRAHVE